MKHTTHSEQELETCKIMLRGIHGEGKYALVSLEDYDSLNKHKWHLIGNDYNKYVARNIYNKGYLYMHKEILGISNTDKLGDHINGNVLDNRRSNLRIATHAENRRNSKRNINGKIPYKGVSLKDNGKRYVAQITILKKVVHLGYFSNAEDAARAYNEAAIKHYGEFAKLNEV